MPPHRGAELCEDRKGLVSVFNPKFPKFFGATFKIISRAVVVAQLLRARGKPKPGFRHPHQVALCCLKL